PLLASYQVSSVIFTGAGKAGSENGRPTVDYQLSQRADFHELLHGLETTHPRRSLVNSRDEALCGDARYYAPADHPSRRMARLHVICYESNLCHIACLLKAGVMQIVLAMLQRGRLSRELILDDPLDAAIRFSHDPELQARAELASGKQVTAL